MFQTSNIPISSITLQLKNKQNEVNYDHSGEQSEEEELKESNELLENEVVEESANPDNMDTDSCDKRAQLREKKMREREEKAKYRQEKERIEKEKKRNTVKYYRLLRENKQFDDKSYFHSLSIEEQGTLLETLRETKKLQQVDIPYRIQLLKSNIPNKYKSIVLRKIQTLESSSHENTKLRSWIDQFMQIPFGSYKHLPVSIRDGKKKCKIGRAHV